MSKYKINELFDIEKGSLQSSKNTPGEYNFITASAEWKTHESFTHDCEALIYAVGASGSLGRTHYVNGKFVTSDLCFILTPKRESQMKINLKVYFHYFNFFREEIVKATATGTSKKAINMKNFSNYRIDYVDNQDKILKNIENVLPIATRLQDINENNQNLSQEMRKKLIEYAVKGKIVEQHQSDESASILLDKSKMKMKQLVKEKKIRKESLLKPVEEEELIKLPNGWKWERIGNLFSSKSGSTPSRGVSQYFDNGTINWVKTRDLNNGYVNSCEEKITKKAMEDNKLQLLPKNTVCIAMYGGGGTIGKVGILDIESTINQSVCALLPTPYIHHKFLYYYLVHIRAEWMKYASGSRVDPNINRTIIRNMPMPVPPLEEQIRIVEKVDGLLGYWQSTKENIEKAKMESENIMKVVLQEAFYEKEKITK